MRRPSGLTATLKAAALGSVFALVFGAAFGVARLSDQVWIRRPAGAVIDIFRSIPLLLLIFFMFYLSPTLFGSGDYTTSFLADAAPSLESLRGGAA